MNLAVTAIGRDRPGIVAAITGALLEMKGNVDDSQMSILHGNFAVMLIVSLPDEASVPELENRLQDVAREFSLGGVTVSELSELDRGAAPTHVLTVYGADRPGIVHAAAELLAARQVNITDLRTRRTGPEDSPLYTMMMEVSVPGDASALAADLKRFGAESQVEVRLNELDPQVL